jgi:hypothetical protein
MDAGAAQGCVPFLGSKPDRRDPRVDETGILPRAQVSGTVDPAGQCIVVNGPRRARVIRQLEQHRPASFLLHDQ